MDIPFVGRSEFVDPCQQVINSSQAALLAGQIIRIELTNADAGYPGNVVVQIREEDDHSFGTNWTGNDPTRFPARIRAAATALHACHCRGYYVITHAEGAIEIRQATSDECENP